MLITSRQNPRILRLVRLRERSSREREGVFLLEGLREIERAVTGGIRITEFYFCPEQIRSRPAQLIAEKMRQIVPEENCFELSASAFEKISYRDKPEGVLAVAEMRKHTLDALPQPHPGEAPLYLVAESIEKPGNLGALLRTADSAGCTALICCGAGTDVYNPNAVRASQGTLFSMPLAIAPAETVYTWLRERNVAVFATTPDAEKLYWNCDFRQSCAILLGTEATGLSPFWLENPEAKSVIPVAIPQRGLADSLNVSMAAGICLFEAVRQRAIFTHK